MDPCIFCSNLADSKEDLFPRWVLKRVQTRERLRRQIGTAPPIITDDREVRLPCVCQTCNNTWMSRMEMTTKKFMGPMIEDLSFRLSRQNQQNMTEWALKCAMCNDSIDVRPRFFTDAECHVFREKRIIPTTTSVFASRFAGRSLDSNGADFTLIDPNTKQLLLRAHVYNIMVGHVVLQVLSWRPEPQHENKNLLVKATNGPWPMLAIQIWPIQKNSVAWPPRLSLSTLAGFTHYGHFRARFKSATYYLLGN